MAEQSAPAARVGLSQRAWGKLDDALRGLDETAARARASDPSAARAAWVTLLVAALSLTMMEYLAGPRLLAQLVNALHELTPSVPAWYELRTSRWLGLLDLTFWVATRTLGFVVLPVLTIRVLLARRVRTFGLARPSNLRDFKPYLLLFALVLPLLIAASLRPEFRSYYPFYRRAGDSWLDLLSWEVLYAFQFFCVEFFFRGFLLSGTHARLGSLAVAAAMIPYCMVHFTKPVLEVLGAIPAGLVLGVLALRTGSIWGGVLLHVAVAWTMDALALAAGAGLPTQLWPD